MGQCDAVELGQVLAGVAEVGGDVLRRDRLGLMDALLEGVVSERGVPRPLNENDEGHERQPRESRQRRRRCRGEEASGQESCDRGAGRGDDRQQQAVRIPRAPGPHDEPVGRGVDELANRHRYQGERARPAESQPGAGQRRPDQHDDRQADGAGQPENQAAHNHRGDGRDGLPVMVPRVP